MCNFRHSFCTIQCVIYHVNFNSAEIVMSDLPNFHKYSVWLIFWLFNFYDFGSISLLKFFKTLYVILSKLQLNLSLVLVPFFFNCNFRLDTGVETSVEISNQPFYLTSITFAPRIKDEYHLLHTSFFSASSFFHPEVLFFSWAQTPHPVGSFTTCNSQRAL